MLWLLGIASAWFFVCLLTISLCVMARRGDDALTAPAPVVPDAEASFVLAFAEPAEEPVAAPRPVAQIPTH